ncbi:MYXO-CTERM sorting domain-containing protein [Nannocystis punicea]|uniref:MYXO-CTERM sorting domain-containing protein n=1 Tax=Nannocystis punicea TaxID=2995304 RepID=A0ABY7H3X0_9BACT|nr:MYXO-CTERM sorting domain-containing protein [Nannocystis poenicansa]WAS93790.1 MYXO-CTERM sorting domain-containing protein [Nannocystis poenicansa]
MRVASTLLGLSLLAACTSEFTFSDSVNSRLYEFKPRAEYGDELSTPYVLGAQFEVFVEDNDQETDFVGWKVESMDPKVLHLRAEPYKMSPHILVVEVDAIGEGVTELLLKDTSGAIRGSAAVEVKRPTRAKLFAAPIYALDNPDFRGETPHPRILVGGTATFAVEYLHEDIRLQGSTDIQVSSSAAIDATIRHSELVDNRNWLQVSVAGQGRHSAELWLGDNLVEEVDIYGVPSSMIAGVELIDGDATTPDELAGEWLLVAQAVAEDKQPIYGVDFEWALPDRGFTEPGDVFIYEHDPDQEFRKVSARAYGVESAISVRVAAGEPASSNDTSLTCSVTGGPPPWALGLLLLGLRRRRRG